MTSLGLQKKGYKTLLVEKEKEIGNLSKKIDIIEDIGLDEITKEYKIKPEITSNVSCWCAGNECFRFKSNIKELFFTRGKLDNSLENQLFKQAIKKGTEIIFSSKTEIKDNRILINGKEINVKIIIGADGTDSLVTKYCYPNEKKRVIQGYGQTYKDLNLPIGETHVIFDQTHIPGGYVYISRTPSLSTIVLGCKNNPNKTNLEIIKKTNPKINEIINKRSGEEIWGKGIISNINNRVYKNILLVGDAARVADPLFLYGVRPALISSDFAVKTINNYFENETSLDNYNHMLNEYLLKEYIFLKIARNTLDKMNQNDIEFVINKLNYIDKNFGLDGISEEPKKLLSAMIRIFVRNPYSSTKLSFKVIKSLFESL